MGFCQHQKNQTVPFYDLWLKCYHCSCMFCGIVYYWRDWSWTGRTPGDSSLPSSSWSRILPLNSGATTLCTAHRRSRSELMCFFLNNVCDFIYLFVLTQLCLSVQAVPVCGSVLHGTETGPAGDGGYRCHLGCREPPFLHSSERYGPLQSSLQPSTDSLLLNPFISFHLSQHWTTITF